MGNFDWESTELEGEYPLSFGSEIYAVEDVSPELTARADTPPVIEPKPRRPIAPERSLQATHPELAAELHPVRNGDLDATMVSAGARLKVWWMCASGHEWKASLGARKKGTGCPVCARRRVPADRSLEAINPELAAELHPSLNGTSAPPILRLRRAARCGGCVPVGTNGRRGSSLVAPAAAVRCARARWCPGSGRWRTRAPRWPRSFTPRATATWTRRGWRPGLTARSGGGAVGAMCGRPRCPAGRRGAAVPSAIGGVGPGPGGA